MILNFVFCSLFNWVVYSLAIYLIKIFFLNLNDVKIVIKQKNFLVHILSRTVQSICTTGTVGGSFDYDQTWICAL